MRLSTAWLSAALLFWAAAAQGAPERVVSLNLCTDQLLMLIAPKPQVAAITRLAADPKRSALAVKAAAYPLIRGRVEEVVGLDPDLVISGLFSSPATRHLLSQLGYPLLTVTPAASIEDIRERIRQLATAIGAQDRGEAVINEMDRRLAAIPVPETSKRPRAAVLWVRGGTFAKGTLVNDIVERAGLLNIAAEIGLSGYVRLSHEELVTLRPEVLVFIESGVLAPSLGREYLRHPVIDRLGGRRLRVTIPPRYWTCGGPYIVEAIERLASARQELER